MQAVRTSDALPGDLWFVRTAGQVWGPYPQARIALFAQEGRVDPATPLASSPRGPFEPAGRQPRLAALFAAPAQLDPPSAPVASASAPAASTVDRLARRAADAAPVGSPPSTERDPAPAAGRSRPLLVYAALSSLPVSRFEAALAAYGEHRAIQPGLWLSRARLGPAALRNALSRRLRGDDVLLVVEAPLDQAAWFNLDPAAERDLRRVWAGEG